MVAVVGYLVFALLFETFANTSPGSQNTLRSQLNLLFKIPSNSLFIQAIIFSPSMEIKSDKTQHTSRIIIIKWKLNLVDYCNIPKEFWYFTGKCHGFCTFPAVQLSSSSVLLVGGTATSISKLMKKNQDKDFSI